MHTEMDRDSSLLQVSTKCLSPFAMHVWVHLTIKSDVAMLIGFATS